VVDPDQKNSQIGARKISGISKLHFGGLAKILTANDLLAKYSMQKT
jgi:hypothetical protein